MGNVVLSALIHKFLSGAELTASEKGQLRGSTFPQQATFERTFSAWSGELPLATPQEFMVTRAAMKIRSFHLTLSIPAGWGTVSFDITTDLGKSQSMSFSIGSTSRTATLAFNLGSEWALVPGEVISIVVTDNGAIVGEPPEGAPTNTAEGPVTMTANAFYT